MTFSVSSPVSVSNMAMLCCLACRSHPTIFISASFVPSLFWLDTAKVYSGRREADVLMSSATGDSTKRSLTDVNECNSDVTPTGQSTGSNSDSGTARPAGVAYCVLNRVAPAALHDMYQRLVYIPSGTPT